MTDSAHGATAGAAPGGGRSARAIRLSLVPALLVCGAAVLLFGLRLPLPGYLALALGVAVAFQVERVAAAPALTRDLSLIALGQLVISTISLEADISYLNMVRMGAVLALAVVAPYLLSRFVFDDRVIRFPWRARRRWTPVQWAYLVLVSLAGWLILPFYFITSGVYTNWPTVTEPDEIARLFVGVNAVGIWDELFFVCTVFALLRRHFPDWLANLLQAIVFVSFLWELGYQSWGPLITIPFALIQGWTFRLTKSLAYVITVHLLFDLVVFLVIVYAHTGSPPIFLVPAP